MRATAMEYAAFFAALVLLASCGTSSDSTLLRWGADQEGGGPYIYPSPEDPSRVVGFEVDLMRSVASSMGGRDEMHQGEWGMLPQLLARGEIDVVTNGYELTEAHLEDKLATIPYYVYELALITRGDATHAWSDLRGLRVGVLNGSAAEAHVAAIPGVTIVGFDGVTQAFEKLSDGDLDATVQDYPAWVYLRSSYPTLTASSELRGRGYYVMYLRPGDEARRDAINAAIVTLAQNGELRRIDERYGIWTEAQDDVGHPETGSEVRGRSRRGPLDVVIRSAPLLLESAGMTVLLSCLSMPLAIFIGLLVALGRLYGPSALSIVLGGYVEFLRGTPLMLQLFMLFYVLPSFGLRVPAFVAAVLGLAINYSAYEAEIYRAGLLAIPGGQMEAALALGMSRVTALRRIVVPQAVRLVVPPVTNDFIALFKDTSVCSVVTVLELTKRYSILANNNTSSVLYLAAVTSVLYLAMSYPLSVLARRLEKKRGRGVIA